jgi:hypothetical protein
MSQWWKDNWDKVAMILISIVLSGVIGFFTAVLSIKGDMDALRERIAKVEAEEASAIIPKLGTMDANNRDIATLQTELSQIRRDTDISVQTNKLLDLRIEEERQKTAQTLKQFLDEYAKGRK